MAACRLLDPSAGPADARMAAYFRAEHHPQNALLPRTGFVALLDGITVGYIAGHLSTRHGCGGELQYLFVAPEWRRQAIAGELVRHLAAWFVERGVRRVCVCLDADSPSAKPFYANMGAKPLSPERQLWYVWEDIGTTTAPR